MIFGQRARPKTMSRERALSMKPIRLVDEDAMRVEAAGNGKLVVRVGPPRFAHWLASKFQERTKTYEFDAVGVYVWRHLDGKTSVEQIIRRLAKQYTLDLRQSEASTTAFLKTLLQRGLIGMPLDRSGEKNR